MFAAGLWRLSVLELASFQISSVVPTTHPQHTPRNDVQHRDECVHQDFTVRKKLAELLSEEEEYTEAARVLAAIDTSRSGRCVCPPLSCTG